MSDTAGETLTSVFETFLVIESEIPVVLLDQIAPYIAAR
jgi:hypothetical protein